MKNLLSVLAVLFLLLFLLPFISMAQHNKYKNQISDTAVFASADEAAAVPRSDEVILLNSDTGEKDRLKMHNYLCGAVVSQMPASYDIQALKAQALCCKTMVSYMQKKGEYLKYSPSSGYGFVDIKTAREQWGDKADEYIQKIESAVNETEDMLITYNGEPILPVFHSISCGQTENASAWWDDVPYLQSADSPYDCDADGFESTVSFTWDELRSRLSPVLSDLTFEQQPTERIKKAEVSDCGNVLAVLVGKYRLNGGVFRTLLGLRSACYDISADDNGVEFCVKGYGHFVGMSKYGAGAMAQNGSDCEEIIKHYFTGVEIVQQSAIEKQKK